MFTVVCFLVWIYLLSVFTRGKLYFYQFIWGSVGLFVFMMMWIQPVAIRPLTNLVCSAAGVAGRMTGFYESYSEYSMLFVQHGSEAISLCIDYECSGIIEMMAYVSMLAFFRVYDWMQRIILSVLGCMMIFFANIIRLFVIGTTIYYFGNDAYYIAHTIVGRIIFYALSVILYYYIFTKSQIVKQKIGGFHYAKNTDTSV
ncbi:MAG TPA: exosortase family protein XrtG [Lachnospiraceae bacterium]|nr:exosortase family protein XrtG [Lachnospiraceae bacterium]HCX41723.1 exosortase family protein XrtG [Lachnospiraceae bacterium]